jgi:hypothetical protein
MRKRGWGGGEEAFNEKESSIQKVYIGLTKQHHRQTNLGEECTENLSISFIKP